MEERGSFQSLITYPPACGMRMRWVRRNINSETFHFDIVSICVHGRSIPTCLICAPQVVGQCARLDT